MKMEFVIFLELLQQHGGNPSDGAIFLDVDANPTNPVYLGEWDDAIYT